MIGDGARGISVRPQTAEVSQLVLLAQVVGGHARGLQPGHDP
eukprot:CAMPEP_0204058026 /NCGR_PEP_ID=MMETSP0360-20130528/135181_1 /ASSEMBLY_ACC=CAM_ASM_000342 /TAXON_ID=268821 /ORGANISM="Scrippsiella Hangoei, Strain SHTV-5" /LENGTH=41 /DNA_ID= /DNA_START= /DNA_END= /DNA_ORIENTATION=